MKKCSFCAVAALFVSASGGAEAAPITFSFSGLFNVETAPAGSGDRAPLAKGVGFVMTAVYDDPTLLASPGAETRASASITLRAPEIGLELTSTQTLAMFGPTSSPPGPNGAVVESVAVYVGVAPPPLIGLFFGIGRGDLLDLPALQAAFLDAGPTVFGGDADKSTIVAFSGDAGFGSVPVGHVFYAISTGDVLLEMTSGAVLSAPEIAPLLPDAVTHEGGFDFTIASEDIDPDAAIWIDPDYAVGYVYEVENALVDAITAPSFASVPDVDGYLLSYETASGLVQTPLAVGATVLPTEPLSRFWITMIDEALMLDPTDGLAFRTGLSFANVTGDVRVTQTPTTGGAVAPIPLPAPLALLASSLVGLAALRRGRRRGAQAG